MNSDKAISMLGICRKAGKLSCGHDAALCAIRQGEAKLCLLSSDASPRLCREVERATGAPECRVALIKTSYTMEDIAAATSMRSAVITINDSGLAARVTNLINTAFGEDTI